jgi:hypothetical protein
MLDRLPGLGRLCGGRKMFFRVLDAIFGCTHSHYSFPITVKNGKRTRASFPTGTYVVCLDCGKEMAYDWKQMKIVRSSAEGVAVASLATKEAA